MGMYLTILRLIPALLLLASCGAAMDRPREVIPDPLIIENDLGGNVEVYTERFRRYEAAGVRVELRGRISSAATMYLGLTNACLGRGMVASFHRAHPDPLGLANRRLARRYPGAIRDRFLEEWGRSREFTRQTTPELIAIEPSLKQCPRRQP